MKAAVRAVIVVVVAAGLGGVVWMFAGRLAGAAAIGNAQVLGALASVAAVLVAVMMWWPRRVRRVAEHPVAEGQADAAIEYLASETLRYWRIQAKHRQITTPSPASVRWAWAGEDVAISAAEIQPGLPVGSRGLVLGESPGRVLTAGVVTQLREQLYQHLNPVGKRMVVLGGPGAGKTGAMLLLLIDILEHWTADSDQPVPVWLTLGGWNPQASSLRDWAAATLTRDYPGLSAPAYGGPDAAAELIRTGRIALFLDGLDEMTPTLQGQALRTIDREAAELAVVLTSRPTEYRAALADGRLYGAAVVNVMPVNVEDAAAFLLAEQLGEHRRAWQHVTDHLRDHPDSVAARTLTTPLALSLARDTYSTADPADLLDAHAHSSPEALLQHLLARTLTVAYPDPAEHAHATQWLSWIAQQMGTSRDLRWWDIHTWTPRKPLRLALGLATGIAVALWLAFWLSVGSVFEGIALCVATGAAAGLAVGLVAVFVTGHAAEPQTVTVRWPARAELGVVLMAGLGMAVGLGAVAGITTTAAVMLGRGSATGPGVVVAIVVGFAVGTIGGVVVGLIGVWTTPVPTAHAVDPLEVYRFDRRSTLTSGLTTGLVAGLALGLAMGLVLGLIRGVEVWVWLGLALGFGAAGVGCLVGIVTTGFGPALLLNASQVIWWLRGRHVRFLPLLQTALHRQVLRQAGAVYQFRHAALQDFLKTIGA